MVSSSQRKKNPFLKRSKSYDSRFRPKGRKYKVNKSAYFKRDAALSKQWAAEKILRTVDYQRSNTVAISGGANLWYDLNIIAQGNNVYNRRGRQIRMKNLQYSVILNPLTTFGAEAAQSLPPQRIRILVVYDKQCSANDAFTGIGDVIDGFDTLDATNFGVSTPMSFANPQTKDRFFIIDDYYTTFRNFTTAAPAEGFPPGTYAHVGAEQASRINPSIKFERFIELNGLSTLYNEFAGIEENRESIVSGSLSIAIVTDGGQPMYFLPSPVVTVNAIVNARLRFYDN